MSFKYFYNFVKDDFYKDSIEDSKLAVNESKAAKIIEREISNSVLDINKWLNSEIK